MSVDPDKPEPHDEFTAENLELAWRHNLRICPLCRRDWLLDWIFNDPPYHWCATCGYREEDFIHVRRPGR